MGAVLMESVVGPGVPVHLSFQCRMLLCRGHHGSQILLTQFLKFEFPEWLPLGLCFCEWIPHSKLVSDGLACELKSVGGFVPSSKITSLEVNILWHFELSGSPS